MARETMSPNERLWAAIRLEKPDRVPVVPQLLPEPAAHLTGLTMAQVASDNQVALEAMFKAFDEYGGWDSCYPGAYMPIQMQAANLYPMRMRIPGKDLPDDHIFQLAEEEVLRLEDYDKICDMGIDRFYYEDYLWRITDLKPEDLPKAIEGLQASFAQFMTECGKRGVQPFFLGYAIHPFFTLSLMRSMVPFTQDLYFNPEPVERALKHMTAELIPKHLSIVKQSGINMWLLVEERASAFAGPEGDHRSPTATVDDRRGNDRGITRVGTPHGDRLASEVEVLPVGLLILMHHDLAPLRDPVNALLYHPECIILPDVPPAVGLVRPASIDPDPGRRPC